MPTKLEDIGVDWPCLFLMTLFITLIFRVLISFMKASEYGYPPRETTEDLTDEMKNIERKFRAYPKRKRFILTFSGLSKQDPLPDYLYNSIIGTVELLIFPILLKAELYGIIGGWIALKTVAQWGAWIKNRYVFNRFLIANAAIVLASYWLMRFTYIVIKT